VGGVLDVDQKGPLLQAVLARISRGPLQVGIDDLSTELGERSARIPLRLLNDDMDLVVREEIISQPAAGKRTPDEIR
jgi:hypothetical protein